MSSHSSVSTRKDEPHETEKTQITIIDTTDLSETPRTNEDHSSREKIEALVEIICGAGDEPAAALLVLMVEAELLAGGAVS